MKKTIKSYDDIARKYAHGVDLKTFNSLYERPNILKHIPIHLNWMPVLDLGCGGGWYSEELSKRHCELTAIDNCKELLKMTQERLKNKGQFLYHDFNHSTLTLKENSINLIVGALFIHYEAVRKIICSTF